MGALSGAAVMLLLVILAVSGIRRHKMAKKNTPWTIEGATQNHYSGLQKQAEG